MAKKREPVSKPVSSRRRTRELMSAGNAADYFVHADNNIKPGDRVILACRKSRRESTDRLQQQIANGEQELRDRGAVVVDVVAYEGSGWEPDIVIRAARAARHAGATKIVFECVNRAVRSLYYHSEKNFEAQANEQQLKELRELVPNDIELVVLLDPSATASEERSHQIRRGQSQSGNKGGRPRKRKRKRTIYSEETIQEALELKDAGNGFGTIAKKLGVPRSTVQSWVSRHAPRCTKGAAE